MNHNLNHLHQIRSPLYSTSSPFPPHLQRTTTSTTYQPPTGFSYLMFSFPTTHSPASSNPHNLGTPYQLKHLCIDRSPPFFNHRKIDPHIRLPSTTTSFTHSTTKFKHDFSNLIEFRYFRYTILVYDKVRIGEGEEKAKRVDLFWIYLRRNGVEWWRCHVVNMDKYVIGSQFITHTIGSVLDNMGLETTPINTKGYETLLELVNTITDSFDLYYGLFMYYEKAMDELQRLGEVFEELKMQLFGHLHELNRNQLFGTLGKGKFGNYKFKKNESAFQLPNRNSGALLKPQCNDTPLLSQDNYEGLGSLIDEY